MVQTTAFQSDSVRLSKYTTEKHFENVPGPNFVPVDLFIEAGDWSNTVLWILQPVESNKKYLVYKRSSRVHLTM